MTSGRSPGSRQTLGILLVVIAAVVSAVSPTAAKVALEAGATTLTVLSARALISVVVMWLALAALGQGVAVSRQAALFALLAGLCHALMSYGYVTSVVHIPVSLAILIFFTHTLLLMVIAHLRGAERLGPRKLALAVAVLGGLGLVLGSDLGVLAPMGIALAVLASVAACGLIVFGAEAQKEASSFQLMFHSGLVCVVVFCAATTGFGAWAAPQGVPGWIGLALAGLGASVGLLAFFAAFRFISPIRAAMISNLEPLAGVLLAVAVLGEWLSPWQWVGVAVVVAALMLFDRASGEG